MKEIAWGAGNLSRVSTHDIHNMAAVFLAVNDSSLPDVKSSGKLKLVSRSIDYMDFNYSIIKINNEFEVNMNFIDELDDYISVNQIMNIDEFYKILEELKEAMVLFPIRPFKKVKKYPKPL